MGTDNLDNKWSHINQLVKEQRIGILAIQEAHLTQEHVDNLHSIFGKRLQIHFSQGPNANAQGVAFVLNREQTNIHDIKQHDIIPGRAMLITIPWHSNLNLTILNIYAPNAHTENRAFWETLQEKWDMTNLPYPDIMLGDFNIVEDALDRLPSHVDPLGPVSELDNLRTKLHLQDGWRTINPTDRAFSYMQLGTGVQSRIDCIYASAEIISSATSWDIEWTAINTDHKMVSTCIVNYNTPFIGRGRWTMPLFLIKDKALSEEIQKLGVDLEKEIANIVDQSSTSNPQLLFKTFKDEVVNSVREHAKKVIPKIDNTIKRLKDQIKSILEGPNPDNEHQCRSAGILEERVAKLENKRHNNKHMHIAAHNKLEGETISKYWSQINKSKKPRDIIYCLEKTRHNPITIHIKVRQNG